MDSDSSEGEVYDEYRAAARVGTREARAFGLSPTRLRHIASVLSPSPARRREQRQAGRTPQSAAAPRADTDPPGRAAAPSPAAAATPRPARESPASFADAVGRLEHALTDALSALHRESPSPAAAAGMRYWGTEYRMTPAAPEAMIRLVLPACG